MYVFLVIEQCLYMNMHYVKLTGASRSCQSNTTTAASKKEIGIYALVYFTLHCIHVAILDPIIDHNYLYL